MARRTMHESCVKCESKAQVCAYTGFYVLTSKPRKAPKSRRQVKGVLPARGFCFQCFLRYAKGQKWNEAVLEKVRTKLALARHAE
jgi:Fe-S-cluster-containing hydrogenase component 2